MLGRVNIVGHGSSNCMTYSRSANNRQRDCVTSQFHETILDIKLVNFLDAKTSLHLFLKIFRVRTRLVLHFKNVPQDRNINFPVIGLK